MAENPDYEREIEEIPVQGTYSLCVHTVPASLQAKEDTSRPKPAKKASGLRASLFMNAVLLLLVALMFYISMTASNPTALNYERAVQNRYSEWEKELSERESAVREKERELLME